MIITITGDAGSGKSTVADMIAKELNYQRYSSGDLMDEIAKERGLTLMEASKLAEKDAEIDRLIDEKQTKIGKEEDNFVIDGRLSWHFIPDSVKIYLKVDIMEGAKRVFQSGRETEPENDTVEITAEMMKQRKESERKRYAQYYNLDYAEESNYDIIIDTTNITASQVKDKLMEFLKNKA